MNRVLVIGNSGGGKSTATRKLGQKLGLPVIHLDREFWQSGWVHLSDEDWQAKVAELVQRDRWVMDGNFTGTFDLRMPRADTVVWLDFPVAFCLGQVIRRVLRNYGQTRSDLPDGCPERWDLVFLHYVATYNKRSRPRVLKAMQDYGELIRWCRFKSRAELDNWIGSL